MLLWKQTVAHHQLLERNRDLAEDSEAKKKTEEAVQEWKRKLDKVFDRVTFQRRRICNTEPRLQSGANSEVGRWCQGAPKPVLKVLNPSMSDNDLEACVTWVVGSFDPSQYRRKIGFHRMLNQSPFSH